MSNEDSECQELYDKNQELTARLEKTEDEIRTIRRSCSDTPVQETEELRRREHEFWALAENSPDSISRFERNLRCTYVNSAAMRLVGLSTDAPLGLNTQDVSVPDEIAKPWEEAVRKAFDTGEEQRLELFFPINDCDTWYDVRIVPEFTPEGTVQSILSIARDISERKHAEEALRESEERLKRSQGIAHLGSWELDLLTNRLTWSDEVYRIFGLKPQEFAATYEAFLEHVHPDDRQAVDDAYSGSIREGRDVYEIEHRVIRSDTGEVRFVHERCEHTRDESGRIICSVGMVQDITERKQAEEALIRARADAERHAAEMEAFISSMADPVVIFDSEPRVLGFNEALREIVGAPSDMHADEWGTQHELYTLEGEPVLREEYPSERSLRGLRTTDARFRMVTPWKESLVSISGSPVCDADGRVVGGTLVIHDIGKQVELERCREELYQRELNITQALQGTLVPQAIPQELYGCKLAVKYQPALKEAEVGGDFFDVFDLGDGRIGVVIGDVAGKGLQAATRVAEARYTIRCYAYENAGPAEVLTRANNTLSRGFFDENSMLTTFFAIIDTNSNTITFANAGHEPPVVVGPDCHWKELHASGIPLGIISGVTYSEESFTLRPGDRVVMITDGIPEARSNDVVLFEKRGVIEYLTANCKTSPSEMINGLLNAAIKHAGGSLQDDAALVVLECTYTTTRTLEPPLHAQPPLC